MLSVAPMRCVSMRNKHSMLSPSTNSAVETTMCLVHPETRGCVACRCMSTMRSPYDCRFPGRHQLKHVLSLRSKL